MQTTIFGVPSPPGAAPRRRACQYTAAMRSPLLPALLLVCALTLAGCDQGGVVTLENFEQIQTGMTQAQVEKILGSGKDETPAAGYSIGGGGTLSSKASPEKIFVWREGQYSITVIFKDGKVVEKSKTGI